MKIRRAVGIDLGTTNSAVAMLDPQGNDIWLFEDRFKRKTLPSMVGWDPERESFFTGWEAFNRRVLEPAPISSIKRKMGTQQRVALGPHEMLPEEISAKLLERMGAQMDHHLEEKEEATYVVDQAVITVPAYFDAPQIEATRRAGELAGLEVVSLLQEPTAAAMYYAWKNGIGDGTFMVYDLGGGTFDVSVIRCMLGEYQVLGIDGDNFLGGDDFDRRLAEHFRAHLAEQGYDLDLDVSRSPEEATKFTLLMRLAQEVKEALTGNEVQYVGRRNIFEDMSGNPVSIELEISRDTFEALIADLVEESLASCERALVKSAKAAEVGLEDIDHVLLVGGSTRVPLVQRRVAQAFCGAPKSRAERPLMDEPDTCVALGAAIHAANVSGLTLLDDETESAVNLSSALSFKRPQARLFGRLSSPHQAQIESVVLLNPAGDIASIARPEPEDGQLLFTMDDIELPDEGRYEFSLEFCDREGDPISAFELSMTRLSDAQQLRSTGSALSNPSVLAKDIYLEVVRDGRPQRQQLLASGASLPAEGKFRFYTADKSGAVILRLFQNRFPIRTIHLSVPEDTELGTAIELNLSVDETMMMVASGELLGQTFWAQIEPPPARELKDWQQIEELLARVDRITRELWGNEARYFQERTTSLVAGIRETARTDPDKLQVLVSRLEEVVEDYHNSEQELTPGHGRMVELLNAIKRVVYRGSDHPKLGLGADAWRERLENLETQADAAFAAHDQAAWSRAFNQVQATWESLAQDEFRFIRSDTEEYVRRLHVSLLDEIQETHSMLGGFQYAANPETRGLQEKEVRRLQEELRSKVEGPLAKIDVERMKAAEAKHELDRMFEAIHFIQRQHEKLPTIGLVRH